MHACTCILVYLYTCIAYVLVLVVTSRWPMVHCIYFTLVTYSYLVLAQAQASSFSTPRLALVAGNAPWRSARPLTTSQPANRPIIWWHNTRASDTTRHRLGPRKRDARPETRERRSRRCRLTVRHAFIISSGTWWYVLARHVHSVYTVSVRIHLTVHRGWLCVHRHRHCCWTGWTQTGCSYILRDRRADQSRRLDVVTNVEHVTRSKQPCTRVRMYYSSVR